MTKKGQPHQFNRQGNSLQHIISAKDPAEKLRLAQAFQAQNPMDAAANLVLGQALYEAGSGASAIPYAIQAVRLSEFAPDAASLLARLYLDFGYHENLGPLLSEARKRHPTAPQLASDLGDYLAAINQPENAVEAYQQALSLSRDVRFAQAVKRSLVDALRVLNRNEDAKALLLELKERPEAQAFALARLAQLPILDDAAALTQDISALLESGRKHLSGSDRSLLTLALGNLMDRAGDTSRAFGLWQAAKNINPPRYDRHAVEELVTRTFRFYDKDLFSSLAAFGSTAQSPVFVVGMPRSGTTLVEQILSAHSQVCGLGEVGRMGRRHFHFLDTYTQPNGLANLRQQAMRGELVNRANEHQRLAMLIAGREYPRMVDKMPTQFLAAGYIHLCLPQARFIHISRHPADTFISSLQSNFPPDYAFTFSPEAFAHFYVQRDRLMQHWRSVFPQKILDISYEDLVGAPEASIRSMLDFLGLDWEPACLAFHEKTRSIRTFSRDQVRHAINTRSVGRWRRFNTELAPLLAALKRETSLEYTFESEA